MKIHFWGVRGSLPTPLTPDKLKSKISSIIQRIQVSDLKTLETRERFLAKLPDYLFSTVGGNTACVEVITDEKMRLIFDAGTGIRELGLAIAAAKRKESMHLFFSHFHWDHIQGLPFFVPGFIPGMYLAMYSPVENFKAILSNQMSAPCFPVTLDSFGASLDFFQLKGKGVRIGNVEIRYRAMNHPNGCYSYAITENGKKLIYSTDTELEQADFEKTPENISYFEGADSLIIDAQYTLGEAIEKQYWGHSSFSLAADFAANWKIKRLILFHHEPTYSDKKIGTILKSASWYLEHIEQKNIEVILAREGLEIEV